MTAMKKFFKKIADFFRSIPKKFSALGLFIKTAEGPVRASMLLMGLGQLIYRQYARGVLFLLCEVGLIYYFASRGVGDIIGFFTLGTRKADPWTGTPGDNSVIMLLMGIFAWIALFALIAIYIWNVKDAAKTAKRLREGKKPLTIKEDISRLMDELFYIPVLAVPVIGVCVFSVLPIVFMILIAFTNYGGNIVPPELVDWVGMDNFVKIATLQQFAPTFFKILGWNLLWAFASTFFNYFVGLGIALLLNKKCVKPKALWRAFPVLAYAIPGFITLLAFKFMFSYGGPINQMVTAAGGSAIGFLDLDAGWMARGVGFLVNMWISTPSIMLLASGVLSNINGNLYEAARIDGASPWRQFTKITLPFVVFSTTPVLLSQFIGNFNNFGIFYFLRGSLYIDGYFLASDTDLLINWLYNLSINNNYYSIGAAVSLIIFLITSVFSLIVYVRSNAYKQEDTYR